ncbi:MAG: ABC transporter ATP-binding protein/permease [Cytophagales bacterium]|nr:ABC transporter ATP-binding protein/permease [Cytophagales bacterium]
MKTYLRILSYARPLGRFVPLYILTTGLAIFFGLVNFSLLVPLLQILFNKVEIQAVTANLQPPTFSMSIAYLKSLFDYYLIKVIEAYAEVGALYFVCLVIITSVFLTNLFRYLAEIIMAKVRNNVIRNLRMAIFDKVSQLHIGYFTNERKGDIMSRVTNDVQEVEYSVVDTLQVVFKEPATIIGFFGVLFYMSAKLTLFTLLLLPISGTIISELVKRLKRKATQSQESLGRLMSILDETLWGIRIIKAFTARHYILDKFKKENENYANINVSMARKNELGSPVSEFMGVLVVTIILAYGGRLVLQNASELTASEFITYITIFSQILVPAKSISSAFSSIQRGLASGRRIFSLIDKRPIIVNKKDSMKIQTFEQAITFKNVTFAYDDKPVLENINFTIEKGKNTALVGPSGAGKSTIADLIPRFYDPTAGEVQIDGCTLKAYELQSLRRLMGIVTQESILFHDTVFNNIAFGKPEASEEAVMKAAQIANAHDFIMALPQGYQTRIGERGSKLSGGQRQRLSIARAILKNPPILILDEATSALDTASEKLVQDALNKLMQHRTSLVIAHRLSTIQHADEIIVIERGKIVERGTHETLIQKEGLYKRLRRMQHV